MTIMPQHMPQASALRAHTRPQSLRHTWKGADLVRDDITASPQRTWPCMRGRYLIHQAILRGPSFHVYRAWDLRLQREVALKMLIRRISDDDDQWALSCRRFAAEAFAMMMAQGSTEPGPATQPHLVRYYGLLKEDRAHTIVMEYLDGVSLRTWMEARHPSYAELLTIAQGICQGLQALHRVGLVHRDLKPENVMITSKGRVVLIDLGIAYHVAHGYEPEESGNVRGTPGYLAPEQLDARPLTPATDIYALGAVLYELLVGEVLFAGDNMQQLLMAHMGHRIPSMRGYAKDPVGKLWVALIQRCLQRADTRRYQNIPALLANLAQIAARLGGPQRS